MLIKINFNSFSFSVATRKFQILHVNSTVFLLDNTDLK